MTPRKTLRGILLAAILTLAVMIFLFSCQNGEKSAETSNKVTETVLTIIEPEYPSLPRKTQLLHIAKARLTIRKLAHFGEFCLLAALLTAYLYLGRKDARLRPVLLPAWGIASLYACTDELHQMFVDARGPSFIDIGIDSSGALTGVLVMTGCMVLYRRIRKKTA